MITDSRIRNRKKYLRIRNADFYYYLGYRLRWNVHSWETQRVQRSLHILDKFGGYTKWKQKNCNIDHFFLTLKVLSHQIRSAWKLFGWIGLDQFKDRGWLKDFLILLPFVNLNFSSPSGIAKHDRCCMQFADTAGKFACGARFCIFESFKS